jgi:hypothetical protein
LWGKISAGRMYVVQIKDELAIKNKKPLVNTRAYINSRLEDDDDDDDEEEEEGEDNDVDDVDDEWDGIMDNTSKPIKNVNNIPANP